jgi:hypothetical protein
MNEPDPDSRVGVVLDGRYRVLERLAEGGMGVVYKAERVPVGRPVAVKFLHEVYASDRESRARFERETRVLSKLTHPHCVSVIDFGVDQGPYLVMDFVTGGTLKDRLEKGPIPPIEAMMIARQTLAGLAHAHAQGITHRDVKPANIMVSDEIGTGNHVRILDFGLARLRGSAATSVTQSSIVVGTPNYMAPEQTVAGEVDARTDVYAMGIVLFEMVTGQRPFSADDTAGVLDMHRHQPPPHLREVAPEIDAPVGLDRVIQRALAKDPADRFQSAVDMANALEAVAEGRRPPRTEPGIAAQKRSSWSMLVFALVLCGGAAGAYVMLGKERAAKNKPAPAADGSGMTATYSTTATPPPVTGPAVVEAPDARAVEAVPDAAAIAMIAMPDAAAIAPILDSTPDAAPALAITDPGTGSGAGAGAGSAGDVPEVDMAEAEVAAADPTVDPNQALPDDDEGDPANPTATTDPTATTPTVAVDPTVAPTPPPVTPPKTIAQAMAMAKKGQREPAIAGLRALWRKNPKSGAYPFALAGLYWSKKWWSIAMEHYGAAIKRSPGYRGNGTMIKNVIQALGSAKTRGKASWFLKRVVGKWAKPYLRTAARSNPNKNIRSAAKSLLR